MCLGAPLTKLLSDTIVRAGKVMPRLNSQRDLLLVRSMDLPEGVVGQLTLDKQLLV